MTAMCNATTPDHYCCTEPIGHTGDHIARDMGDEIVAQWPLGAPAGQTCPECGLTRWEGKQVDGYVSDLRGEIERLRRIGDHMQSEASRLAEWVDDANVELPYEVMHALIGVHSAIGEWTQARIRVAATASEA